jgi:hypothetical protein
VQAAAEQIAHPGFDAQTRPAQWNGWWAAFDLDSWNAALLGQAVAQRVVQVAAWAQRVLQQPALA